MKKNQLQIATLAIFCIAVACTPSADTSKGSFKDLSSFAKNFIGINQSANTAMAPSRNGVMSASAGTMNQFLGNAGAVTTTSDSSSLPACGSYQYIQNPDGSITYTSDYGKGCETDYGDTRSIMFGKTSFTYKYTNTRSGSVYHSDYYSRFYSQNFGGQYITPTDTSSWLSNGHGSYHGSSSYDTAKQTYEGNYSYSDTSDYSYNKTLYSYQSIGTSYYNNQKSVDQMHSYRYANGDDYYKSVLLAPIVRDYSCNAYGGGFAPAVAYCMIAWPVSGREVIQYRQNGVEGQFTIDYGDGSCDSLITIIEDGKEIVIDMSNWATLMAANK